MYRKRNLIMVKEITFSYNQISRVNLVKGILFFAEIELATTGRDDVKIKWVPKGKGVLAKKIIDQKLYHAHAKHRPGESKISDDIKRYEKSLARLKELQNKDALSQRDYKKMKKDLLKKLR